LFVGCGSSTTQTPTSPPRDGGPDLIVQEVGPSDATINGCDEDAVGENYFIQNCTPGGGNGTPILRQLPTAVQNNCQP
jgi:hypothetical protein